MDLRAFTIFAQLDDTQIEAVRNELRVKTYGKRDVVCHKDDRSDGLFLLFSGRLQAIDIAEDGREIGLNLIRAGSFFGELGVIDGLPRSAHIVAIEPSVVGFVPEGAARDLFYRLPGTAEAMMKHLTALVRSLSNYRTLLAIPNAFQRVYVLLVQLMQPVPGGLMVITNPPKQQEFAIMVNTSRETVSRAITQLIAQGVLEKDYRRLIVRQPERLRELAAHAT